MIRVRIREKYITPDRCVNHSGFISSTRCKHSGSITFRESLIISVYQLCFKCKGRIGESNILIRTHSTPRRNTYHKQLSFFIQVSDK